MGKVFYVTPKDHPAGWTTFPMLSPRTRFFEYRYRPLPLLRGMESSVAKWMNKVIDRANDWSQQETILEDILRCIEEWDIDVLLFCPQNAHIDVVVAPKLVKRTGLPSVAWFMDDYFTDELSRSRVRKIWDNAHRRFVISESMREHFSGLYGGDCEVLNNSVTFPERYPEPDEKQDHRLRMVYAGAMNIYYRSAMSAVLGELEKLGERVILDIYSPDELPSEWRSRTDVPWRHLPPIPTSRLVERLQKYDVLLLLSSFEPTWRTTAETAQAGKMADYLAAGRCILAYGPPYAENVRYLERYGIGETVTSQEPGVLKEAVLTLAQAPGCRREVGERAYRFGKTHRDRAKNSTRLWQALSEASGLSSIKSIHRSARGRRTLLRRGGLRAINALDSLKKSVRRVIKR